MTLDTKAREAAVRDGCNSLMDIDEHWKGCRYPACVSETHGCAHEHPFTTAIKTYLTTRSESLPDELKAIAERHERHAEVISDMLENGNLDGPCQVAVSWLNADRAALLQSVLDESENAKAI